MLILIKPSKIHILLNEYATLEKKIKTEALFLDILFVSKKNEDRLIYLFFNHIY